MRKLIVGTFLTLDGVMQAPGGPDEDRSGGFEHGGWSVPFFDDLMGRVMVDWMAGAGGFLLGRRTYDIFAAHWPRMAQEDPNDPIAAVLDREPKYVASRTLDRVDWRNSHLIEGDLASEVRKLKEQDGGEIQVHGSGNLIQSLLRHDLIDGLRLWIHPIVLGSGKRLFGEGAIPAGLKLTTTETASTGVVLHVYERAGEIQHGSFSIDDVGKPGYRSPETWSRPS